MFTLIVPVGQSAYSEAERSHEQVNQLEAFPLEENPLPVKPDPDLDKEKKQSWLLMMILKLLII